MSKHTPGPWVIHPTFAQIDAGPIINGKLTPVCKMLWPTDLRSEEETMVNAELIASLPELVKQNAQMLEALEAIEEGMMHDFHYVCQEGLVKNCLCYKCQKIRIKAAIVAAKGEI